MAKEDFGVGLLQGLYQSGVGNPRVNMARRKQGLAEQAIRQKQVTDQQALGNKLAGDHLGAEPEEVQNKIGAFIKNLFYPGSGAGERGLQQEFVTDPDSTVSLKKDLIRAQTKKALRPAKKPTPKADPLKTSRLSRLSNQYKTWSEQMAMGNKKRAKFLEADAKAYAKEVGIEWREVEAAVGDSNWDKLKELGGSLVSGIADSFNALKGLGGPKVGDADGGYIYQGGDKSLPSSWKKQ